MLVAVNGSVYDVTKGKRFYGPGKLTIFSFITSLLLISIHLFKVDPMLRLEDVMPPEVWLHLA